MADSREITCLAKPWAHSAASKTSADYEIRKERRMRTGSA